MWGCGEKTAACKMALFPKVAQLQLANYCAVLWPMQGTTRLRVFQLKRAAKLDIFRPFQRLELLPQHVRKLGTDLFQLVFCLLRPARNTLCVFCVLHV